MVEKLCETLHMFQTKRPFPVSFWPDIMNEVATIVLLRENASSCIDKIFLECFYRISKSKFLDKNNMVCFIYTQAFLENV